MSSSLYSMRLYRHTPPPANLPTNPPLASQLSHLSMFPDTPLQFCARAVSKKNKKNCVLSDVTVTVNWVAVGPSSEEDGSKEDGYELATISSHLHKLTFSPNALGLTARVTVSATAKGASNPAAPISCSFDVFICEAMLAFTDAHNERWKSNDFEFYKDDGGKEGNYIEMNLKLIDKLGLQLLDKECPLNFSLIYDNDELENVSTLADVMTDNFAGKQQYIDATTGENANQLHLRIEEVSKNHQSQYFRFVVSPKIENSEKESPDWSKIGFVCSDVIYVKSKRHKKRKTTKGVAQSLASEKDAGGSPSSSIYNLNKSQGTQLAEDMGRLLSWAESAAASKDFCPTLKRNYEGSVRASVGRLDEFIKQLTHVKQISSVMRTNAYSNSNSNSNSAMTTPLQLIGDNTIGDNLGSVNSSGNKSINQVQFLNNNLLNSGGSSYSAEGNTPPKKRMRMASPEMPPRPPTLSDNKSKNSSSSDSFPAPFPLAAQQSQLSMNLSLFNSDEFDNHDTSIPATLPIFDSQMSSNFVGPGSVNVGNFSSNTISDFPKAEIAPKKGNELSENSMQRAVWAIWAKKWCGKGIELMKGQSADGVQYGFPAFDKEKRLLGFYREVVSEGGQLVIIFVPLAEFKENSRLLPTVTSAERNDIVNCLFEEMKGGSESIHTLATSKGDVGSLIEAVSMYFWTKNMINADNE